MSTNYAERRADLAPPSGDPVETPGSDQVHARQIRSTAHDHDILTTAEGAGRLGTFVDYMRAAGLSELLSGGGPYTVFAPTDRAFDKITLGNRDALLADRKRLGAVMRGHIVAGSVAPPAAGTTSTATTIEGTTLSVSSSNGSFHVGDARLVQTSIPASNGIIHAIDAVLLGT